MDQEEQAEIVKMDETPAKYAAMFRRAKKGSVFIDLIWAAESLPVTLGWSIQMRI